MGCFNFNINNFFYSKSLIIKIGSGYIYQETTKKFNFINQVKYCDIDKYDLLCTECPENSICKNGLIVGCQPDFVFVNGDICINKNQKETLIMKFYILGFNLIAENNGKNCKSFKYKFRSI